MPEEHNQDQDQDQDNPARMRAAIDAERAARQAAERQLALAQHGIPLNTPLGQLFAAGYTGETTPDAIRAAWEQVAPTAPTTPPPSTEGGESEGDGGPDLSGQADSTDQRTQLAQGGTGGTQPLGDDPRDVMRTQAEQLRQQGVGRDKILASGFETLVGAAAQGDKRVLVDVWGPKE